MASGQGRSGLYTAAADELGTLLSPLFSLLFCLLLLSPRSLAILLGMALRGLDEFTRTKLRIGTQPWHAPSVSKDDRAAFQSSLVERRQKELQAIADRVAAEKEERKRAQDSLKAVKDQREKERKAALELQKEAKKIAQEKAAIEKEERRIKAREEAALKRERDKEEAVAKAKLRAERQALDVEERERKVSSAGAVSISSLRKDRSATSLSRPNGARSRS